MSAAWTAKKLQTKMSVGLRSDMKIMLNQGEEEDEFDGDDPDDDDADDDGHDDATSVITATVRSVLALSPGVSPQNT